MAYTSGVLIHSIRAHLTSIVPLVDCMVVVIAAAVLAVGRRTLGVHWGSVVYSDILDEMWCAPASVACGAV